MKSRMMLQAVRRVAPVRRPDDAVGVAVYEQMAREVGLLPPFLCHASRPDLLAAVWGLGREAWLAGPVGRLEREAVAAGVSVANECPFCVEAHTMTLRAGGHRSVGDAIRAGGDWESQQLRPFHDWAAGSLNLLDPPDPPFPDREAPWFVGTAVAFHYVNRVVNVLVEASGVPPRLRRFGGIADRVADAMFGKPMVSAHLASGEAVGLPATADVPDDLAWATADGAVARAAAAADLAIDAAGAEVYDEPARRTIREAVAAWSGVAPGPSRAWLDTAVENVPETDAPAVRLGLLVAMASFQVTDADVDAFRAARPLDDDLVAAVAWPAWLAAKRVGTSIAP